MAFDAFILAASHSQINVIEKYSNKICFKTDHNYIIIHDDCNMS
jgi:hypothetical protein